MSGKHTAGPWELSPSGAVVVHRHDNGDTHVALVIDSWICSPDPCEAEANARLIASAPAMLEALRAMEAIGSAGVIERRETGKPTWNALDAIRDLARQAIHAATGE